MGGLTKVVFSNTHLVYAVTWFTLALMALARGAYVVMCNGRERRQRRRPGEGVSGRGAPSRRLG